MSFQSGTATGPTDLLTQLAAWLVSIGWNQDMSASDGSLGGWRAHLDLGGVFVNLRSKQTTGSDPIFAQEMDTGGYCVALYLGTGFNGSVAWNAQAGAPLDGTTSAVVGAALWLTPGPYTNYYFFADASSANVTVVVEKTPGIYGHMGWGNLLKNGTWTGGPFFFASTSGLFGSDRSLGPNNPGTSATAFCPMCHNDANGYCAAFVRVDVDSFTGKWIGISSTASGGGWTGKFGASSVCGNLSQPTAIAVYCNTLFSSLSNPQPFQYAQTSAQDGRVNLLPIMLWVQRDGAINPNQAFSPIGTPQGLFFSNGVGNGFAGAEIYPLGGDNYMMFPNFAVKKV
jgi:hypothetical protein